MTVTCPHCSASGQIDETRIPPGVTSIRCPRCKQSLPIPEIPPPVEENRFTSSVDDVSVPPPLPPVTATPLSQPSQPAGQDTQAMVTPPPLPESGGAPQECCSVCSSLFPQAEMVRFGTIWVCAACKPTYMQILTRGKSPDQQTGVTDELRSEPRVCTVSEAMGWISLGFATFKRAVGGWIGLTVLFVLMMIVVSLVTSIFNVIPVIGSLLGSVAVTIIVALLTGGVMLGCRAVDQGGELKVSYLFAAFENPGRNQLVLAELIKLAVGMAVWTCLAVMLALVVGAKLFTIGARGFSDFSQLFSQPGVLAGVIFILFVAMLLQTAVYLLFLYIPMLTMFHQLNYNQAVSLSCKGAFANLLPLFVYSLVMGFLMVLGMIPLMLGLLVVYPVMMAASYHSYKQIFLTGK